MADWPPALWGSSRRIQYRSESDRQRCRSLRARSQPRRRNGRFTRRWHCSNGCHRDPQHLSCSECPDLRYEQEYVECAEALLAAEAVPPSYIGPLDPAPREVLSFDPYTTREISDAGYSRRNRAGEWQGFPLYTDTTLANGTITFEVPVEPITLHAEWQVTDLGTAAVTPIQTDAQLGTNLNIVNYITTDSVTTNQISNRITTYPTAYSNYYHQNGNQPMRWVERDYIPGPTPTFVNARISAAMVAETPDFERLIELTHERLMAQARDGWKERYGSLPEKEIWTSWLRRVEDTHDYEIGLGLAHNEQAAERAWGVWANEEVAATVAPGRPRVPTPEELVQAEQARLEADLRREEQRRLYEEQERERKEDGKRAEALLLRHLTEEQRRSWKLHHYFNVCIGRTHYQIALGRAGNVYRLNSQGRRERTYCIHSREHIPDADTCLAQKLLLEANPEEFLRIANESGY